MVLAHLVQGRVWLVHRMPIVQSPIEGYSFAPLAWTYLPKHDIGNAQFLVLILHVRIFKFFVNDEACAEHAKISIYLGEHVCILPILIIHNISETIN